MFLIQQQKKKTVRPQNVVYLGYGLSMADAVWDGPPNGGPSLREMSAGGFNPHCVVCPQENINDINKLRTFFGRRRCCRCRRFNLYLFFSLSFVFFFSFLGLFGAAGGRRSDNSLDTSAQTIKW